ncbi:hypothetical protein [Pontibacter cellulosilyticus]|uniref:DUF2231 domain-containing protein n=1 Tax=Pontibacter cellulosilyticus TaxID=1720253 RepID=A0A923SIQ0_9BACT|nr:hypothetical protein [Pontibacter cellulosilyticus]MBC5991901.1 hypothetical protein [Pontibacter cellulosilyticus]
MIRRINKYIALSTLLLSIALLNPTASFAHGGEKHDKKTKKEEEVSSDTAAAAQDTIILEQAEITAAEHAQHEKSPATVHASLDDFPNRHPLFVHFPIVLLLVAAAIQLANVIFLRKELDWITTLTVLVGFTLAFYVTYLDHPHTTGLTAHAELVLEQHDFYADWTIYLAGAALMAQLLSQFLFKSRRWSVALVAVVLAGAAYTVSMAGHYGAQLVYLEGIGPKGQYLETGHAH